jgi:hypothetical protein
MIFGNIYKPIFFFVFFHNKIILFFDGTFRNISLFFFFRVLISKQISVAFLFSFPGSKHHSVKILRMIPHFFYGSGSGIGNTQIIHMEETGITQRTIGLQSVL